jgi:hypothetical protein
MIGGASPPREVAIALPALFAIGRAVMLTIIACGALSLYTYALGTMRRRWAPPAITMAILFLMQVESNASPSQLALSIVSAAVLAVVAWLVARYILGDNPLAWPLALFTITALQSALSMLGNHRADLIVQGWALLAAIAALLVFFAMSGGRDVERI